MASRWIVGWLIRPADAQGQSAEAEHRVILAAALLTPPRRNPAERLVAMPDLGRGRDFQRPADSGETSDVVVDTNMIR